jgi:DNA repair exonuclease SbcCD ATPase subunit
MKNDYSDNLSKLEEILKKRDDDINNIIEQYRKEKEDLTTELQSYIQQFDSSEFAYKDMCTKLNNQKIEIDNLKEKLDKSYKKYIEEMNQRKKIEKENEILQKKNEELTSSVDRLNRITHGRFKSMASKSVYSAKTDY